MTLQYQCVFPSRYNLGATFKHLQFNRQKRACTPELFLSEVFTLWSTEITIVKRKTLKLGSQMTCKACWYLVRKFNESEHQKIEYVKRTLYAHFFFFAHETKSWMLILELMSPRNLFHIPKIKVGKRGKGFFSRNIVASFFLCSAQHATQYNLCGRKKGKERNHSSGNFLWNQADCKIPTGKRGKK